MYISTVNISSGIPTVKLTSSLHAVSSKWDDFVSYFSVQSHTDTAICLTMSWLKRNSLLLQSLHTVPTLCSLSMAICSSYAQRHLEIEPAVHYRSGHLDFFSTLVDYETSLLLSAVEQVSKHPWLAIEFTCSTDMTLIGSSGHLFTEHLHWYNDTEAVKSHVYHTVLSVHKQIWEQTIDQVANYRASIP